MKNIVQNHVFLVKILCTVDLIAGLFMATAAQTNGASNGVINGTIVNGTSGGSSISGLTVNLYSYQNNSYLNMVSVAAYDDGSFTFNGILTDSIYSYEATVAFKNVEYTSGVFQFDNTEAVKTITVSVYETTTSDSKIKISLAHTVISLTNGSLTVKEILAFENSGDQTYIGSVPAGTSGHYQILKFSLPPKSTNLTATSGLLQDYLVTTDTGFVDTMPVAPGTIQLAYTYTISNPGKTYQYTRVSDYAMDTLDILIQGQDIGFSGIGFTQSDPLDMGGTTYSYYYTSAISAGGTITYTLTGLPSSGVSSGASSTLIVITVAILVVGVLVFVLIMQSRKKKPSDDED